MIRSKKYTVAAKQQQCTLQIVGVCNHDPDTVVFCHFPDGHRGMGLKADDISGGDGCSSCHDMVDGRAQVIPEWSENKQFYMRRSMTRTIRRRIEDGILVLK